jgi:hypothetical protein
MKQLAIDDSINANRSGTTMMSFEAESGAAGPRFCPRCGKERPAGFACCEICGDALLNQGYCGVCDRFWPLPAGGLCPKHEVALDDQPPALEPRTGPGETATLVTVTRLASAAQAQAARIRLEAEGIPTFLEGELMGQTIYAVATGGIALQVPEHFASDARVLLSQTWAPEAADELDDAWDELGPDPGARRRSIMKGLILVFLFGPIVIYGLGVLLGF